MKSFIRKGVIIVFGVFFLSSAAVYADDNYYTNNNGVVMNETQYNKMLQIFPEKKVADLTQQEFDKVKDGNIIDTASRFEKIVFEDGKKVSSELITEEQFLEETKNQAESNTKGSSDYASHETSYKILSASIVEYNSVFTLIANLDWKRIPYNRSYDVFAFYLNNFSYYGFGGTQTYYTSSGGSNIYYTTSSAGYKSFSNGAGVSMNLKDGTNIIDYVLTIGAQLNKTTTNAYGRVYVSYQHAQGDLTRTQSKSYTLSLSGLGNVVYYSDPIIMNTYDGMGGVSLRVDI